MDYDALKSINDNIKRANGKLILENDALNKQIEALSQELALAEKKIDSLNVKMQDLMMKGDSLFDKKESLKKENKELLKSNNYLKSIIETLQREKPQSTPGSNKSDVKEPDMGKKAIIKNKLKDLSEGKYLNPVYERISGMMGMFFENQAVDSNSIKEHFGVSRATFARDTKILKDMGYIELTNSKKEGLYNLTKSGKKLKKELKKEMKKA
jgi:cell division septum initiation protein DivIVA